MYRKSIRACVVAAASSALVVGVSGTALADDCFNVSRHAAPTPAATEVAPGIYEQGLWTYDASYGAWGKTMPGTEGTNGNYTNGVSDEQGGVAPYHSTTFCTTPNRNPATGNLHGIEVPAACHWGP